MVRREDLAVLGLSRADWDAARDELREAVEVAQTSLGSLSD